MYFFQVILAWYDLMIFFIWLLFLRFCAYEGSKRVIGGFDGFMLSLCLGIVGLAIVLSSRRLDDSKANAALI
jgi:hypothetical protein